MQEIKYLLCERQFQGCIKLLCFFFYQKKKNGVKQTILNYKGIVWNTHQKCNEITPAVCILSVSIEDHRMRNKKKTAFII